MGSTFFGHIGPKMNHDPDQNNIRPGKSFFYTPLKRTLFQVTGNTIAQKRWNHIHIQIRIHDTYAYA